MRKISFLILTIIALTACVFKVNNAFGQEEQQAPNKPDAATEETGDVILKPTPKSENAIFKGTQPVEYKLNVRNNTNKLENGKISYVVTTGRGQARCY